METLLLYSFCSEVQIGKYLSLLVYFKSILANNIFFIYRRMPINTPSNYIGLPQRARYDNLHLMSNNRLYYGTLIRANFLYLKDASSVTVLLERFVSIVQKF